MQNSLLWLFCLYRSDKNTCESIELNSDNPYESCSFTNNQCKKVKKNGLSCDSYKSGQDPEYCYYIELDNSKKYCEFYNNKCKEYFKKQDNLLLNKFTCLIESSLSWISLTFLSKFSSSSSL